MNYYKRKYNINQLFLLLCILFFLNKKAQAWEIIDDIGQKFTGEKLPKIITLAPHLTELAYSVGLAQQLIGVSEYSDYPEAAKKMPQIGNAWSINLEKIVSLKPDLILVWENGTPKAQIEQLRKHQFKVVLLKSEKLTDPARHLRLLSHISPKIHQKNTEFLAQNYLLKLKSLQNTQIKNPKKIFYLISQNPIYTVSSASTIGQAIDFCGGKNIFEALKLPAPEVSIESILLKKPDIILHSISDKKSQNNLNLFWQKWLPNSKIIYVPEDPLVRPSLRLMDGIQAVCRSINSAQ